MVSHSSKKKSTPQRPSPKRGAIRMSAATPSRATSPSKKSQAGKPLKAKTTTIADIESLLGLHSTKPDILHEIYNFAGDIFHLAELHRKHSIQELHDMTSKANLDARIQVEIDESQFSDEFEQFYNWAQEKLKTQSEADAAEVSARAWAIQESALDCIKQLNKSPSPSFIQRLKKLPKF